MSMMAPSMETSCYGSLPLVQPSPVCQVAAIFNQLAEPPRQDTGDMENNMDVDTPHTSVNPFTAVIHSAFKSLTSSSASFLITPGPVVSASVQPPEFNTVVLSPSKGHYQQLLALKANTPCEREYQMALYEAEVREAHFKGVIAGLQGAALLQGCYCDTLQSQLAAQEEKSKSKKKGKLVGDGLPWLLTDQDFIMRVQNHEDA